MKLVIPIGGVVGPLIIAAVLLVSDYIAFGLLFLGVAVLFFFGGLLLGRNR